MRKILRHYITVILLVGEAAASYADGQIKPGSIVVITSHHRPVTGMQLLDPVIQPTTKIYYLDAISIIEDQLSESLPADVDKAKALVDTRIADIGQPVFEQQLRHAYQPLLLMMRYQLDRYPAIIFDRQAVIYGMTDIHQAIKLYQHWVKTKQGSRYE